jgi:hypothetical protein
MAQQSLLRWTLCAFLYLSSVKMKCHLSRHGFAGMTIVLPLVNRKNLRSPASGNTSHHELYGPINDPEWFTLVTQNAPSNMCANQEA